MMALNRCTFSAIKVLKKHPDSRIVAFHMWPMLNFLRISVARGICFALIFSVSFNVHLYEAFASFVSCRLLQNRFFLYYYQRWGQLGFSSPKVRSQYLWCQRHSKFLWPFGLNSLRSPTASEMGVITVTTIKDKAVCLQAPTFRAVLAFLRALRLKLRVLTITLCVKGPLWFAVCPVNCISWCYTIIIVIDKLQHREK